VLASSRFEVSEMLVEAGTDVDFVVASENSLDNVDVANASLDGADVDLMRPSTLEAAISHV